MSIRARCDLPASMAYSQDLGCKIGEANSASSSSIPSSGMKNWPARKKKLQAAKAMARPRELERDIFTGKLETPMVTGAGGRGLFQVPAPGVRSESQVTGHHQVTGARRGTADHAEAVVIGSAARSCCPAAASPGVAESHCIGQVVRLTLQLEFELLSLEQEDAGDIGVHLEQPGTIQATYIMAGGPEDVVGR